jgi:hypothetical protein
MTARDRLTFDTLLDLVHELQTRLEKQEYELAELRLRGAHAASAAGGEPAARVSVHDRMSRAGLLKAAGAGAVVAAAGLDLVRSTGVANAANRSGCVWPMSSLSIIVSSIG